MSSEGGIPNPLGGSFPGQGRARLAALIFCRSSWEEVGSLFSPFHCLNTHSALETLSTRITDSQSISSDFQHTLHF